MSQVLRYECCGNVIGQEHRYGCEKRAKPPTSPGPVLSDLLSCRNEFEKWMVAEKWDIASGGLSRDIEEEETYEYTGTQVMWEAWKAAWDKKAR